MSIAIPSVGSDSIRNLQHLCRQAGCGHWGAWGYDAGEGVTGWWCLEHRPDRDPVHPLVEQNWVSDGNEG